MQITTRALQQPLRSLTLAFVAWKALLLLVAACSPGPGYDTSTALLLADGPEQLATPLHFWAAKLMRWDALYFVKVANRGYLFEQEWAWGWGYTRLIAGCTTAVRSLGVPHFHALEAVVAIGIAHVAHLLSVLVLFELSLAVFPASTGFAFVAALLHIISPAGLFLSAPYAESTCALLTFTGALLFTKSLAVSRRSSVSGDVLVLASGIIFGLATTFRSNAILNGLLLLEEAFRTLWLFQQGFQVARVRRLVFVGLGGLSVAVGFVLPQYIAYTEYCGNATAAVLRPWCQETIPSVYTFVQAHYWNVGLFRYWTISNIPLFLLATPMYLMLFVSGTRTLQSTLGKESTNKQDQISTILRPGSDGLQTLQNMAVSQLLFAVLLLTTAHVQIVSRVASACPVWVWYLAGSCQKGDALGKGYVKFMIMYAIIQGGLYASFLPPA